MKSGGAMNRTKRPPPPKCIFSEGGDSTLWLFRLPVSSGADLRRGEELLVGCAQTRVAQQEEASELVFQRARLFEQDHVHLFGEVIALASVAGAAAGDEVFPAALATA